MNKLLAAGIVRLLRLRSLWLSCAAVAAMEVMSIRRLGETPGIDNVFFLFAAAVGLLTAIVAAMLIGPEYGEGAMRNKIATGAKRRDVYLANLLLTTLAALMICLSAILPALAAVASLHGSFAMGGRRAAMYVLGILAMSVADAAIFTLVAMLMDNRAVAAVTGIVLALALMLMGSYVYNSLLAPPTVNGWVMSVDGQVIPTDPSPNPNYIPEGPVRDIFEFLDIALPGGQAIHYTECSVDQPGFASACSVVIAVLTTGLGLAIFKRKDLK